MTTIEMVKVYINQLCAQIGISSESIYNEQYKSWNFSKGEHNIEVFFTSYETSSQTVRTFLRCFSAVYPLPVEPQKQLDMYRLITQYNAQYMGIKLGVLPDKPFLFLITERDISGMDFNEFSTVIGDFAYWVERLNGEIRSKLGNPQTQLN